MSRKDVINIIVAESYPVIALGLTSCLRHLDSINVKVRETSYPSDLHDIIMEETPDLVIVDPHFGGVFDPEELRRRTPGCSYRIAAIAMGGLDRQMRKLYDEVIDITDSVAVLSGKISKILPGNEEQESEREPVSKREKEIIALVAKGMTNKEIADSLFLSVNTVITHRRNIARKLEIHSATGLTIYAIVNHLVELSDIPLS